MSCVSSKRFYFTFNSCLPLFAIIMSSDAEAARVETVVTVANKDYKESFRYSLRPVIFICQIFGFFPLNGLASNDLIKIKFTWKSPRIYYALLFEITVIITAILNIYKHYRKDDLTPATFHSAIFYITASLSSTIFLLVDWRRFFFEWSKVENIFFSEKYKHAPTCMTLKRRVLLCFFIGALAFVIDQFIFICSEVRKTIHLVEVCNFTKNSLFEDVIVFQLDQIFDFIPYNHAFGVIAEFLDFAQSVYWTFPDIFIMLLSIGISYRFEQINKRIEYFKCRIIPNELWNEVRVHHTEVCELVKIVNRTFDKLIILATLNNAYLMLVQMLYILAWQPFFINQLFHIYSVALMYGKTIAMFLVSAKIHENSQKPMRVLRSIPQEGWTPEVERFFDQVLNENTAFSGMGFFIITRSKFFKLCGAIFTLQLILYEYNKVDVEHSSWYSCKI